MLRNTYFSLSIVYTALMHLQFNLQVEARKTSSWH